MQMVEEKARCVLARSEFSSFCYYMDEYTARHMSIEAFVQVILEMLNTSEKVISHILLDSIRTKI